MKRRLGIILICLAGVITQYWMNISSHEENRRKSTTSFNQRAVGLSVLYEFLAKVKPDQVFLNQQPFLTAGTVTGTQTLLVLSPISYFSKREADVVKKFLEDGGTLILGVQNSDQMGAVKGIVSSNHVPPLVEWPEFENGIPDKIKVEESAWSFEAGKTYAFYSKQRIENCVPDTLGCYFYETAIGKGKVIFLIGLPIFTNVLLSEADNSQLLYSLASTPGNTLIDEYHHLFSNRTLWDLILQPQVGVPLLGLLSVVVLFFMFGHSPFHESSLLPSPRAKSLTLHRLNEDLLQYPFEKPTSFPWVLRKHLEFLRLRFPGANQRISKVADRVQPKLTSRQFFSIAQQAFQLHKELLKERGRT